jgi:dihydrolipoamide dehydrogenase
MANSTYDLIVIGSGPGGYVCAIRAAQVGLKTALVEKDKTFGGTCLNVGCIPSKALLHASELYEQAGHTFKKMGIAVGVPKLDLPAMMTFKDEGVDGNVKGVAFLLKKNKVDTFQGVGRIAAPGKVEVNGADGKAQTLDTKSIVIATGSDVARLPGITIDEKRVVSSTGALVLDKVPAKLLVIGAGVIGLELGSVWRRLGAEVMVVEFLDRILPGMDNEVCRQFQRLLEKQGIAFKLSSKVTAVDTSGNRLKAKVEPAAGGAAETIEADVVLVAVVYTYPEIASVGKSEEELKAAGVAYNVGKFPFTANGRAKVNLQTEGFVKILADAKTDRVLGVHIVGPDAGNMIAEAAVAMEFGAAADDIARTCHAHPTLTEAVKEAALAVGKRSIHM